MSFGFSVGDFIAVGKLISDIINCLQTVGGARSEYQELTRELQTLQSALKRLDELDNDGSGSPTVDSIKFAALSCRHTLEDFLRSIRKFEASLGLRSSVNLLNRTKDKLKWALTQDNNVTRLQNYLNVHIGTINILLMEHGFERLDLTEKITQAFNEQVRDHLQASQGFLLTISNNILAQMLVVRDVQSMVGGLQQLLCGELKASWDMFGKAVAQVWYV